MYWDNPSFILLKNKQKKINGRLMVDDSSTLYSCRSFALPFEKKGVLGSTLNHL